MLACGNTITTTCTTGRLTMSPLRMAPPFCRPAYSYAIMPRQKGREVLASRLQRSEDDLMNTSGSIKRPDEDIAKMISQSDAFNETVSNKG